MKSLVAITSLTGAVSLLLVSLAHAKPLPLPIKTSPRITISRVVGHTAYYNAVTDFHVTLDIKPKSDVIIPIRSSDPSEGIVLNGDADEITELVFTPENWRRPQMVIVKGRNKNVVDGKQDYSIILSAAESVDSNYHGIDPDDVPMKGITLTLNLPDTTKQVFLAGEPSRLSIGSDYSEFSSANLRFELPEAPEGMVLDNQRMPEGKTELTWTPKKGDVGKNYTVRIRVTDGVRTDEASFPVAVQQLSIPLALKVTDRTVKLTDSSTNLQGLELEVSDERLSPGDFQFSKMDAATLPTWTVPRVTDVFHLESRLIDGLSEDLNHINNAPNLVLPVLRIPVGQLPAGINSDTHKVYLYRWLKHGVLGGSTPFWQPSPGSFVTVNGEQFVEFKRVGIRGLYYISADPDPLQDN